MGATKPVAVHPESFLAFSCSALAYDKELERLLPGEPKRVYGTWLKEIEGLDCIGPHARLVALSTYVSGGNCNLGDTAQALNRGIPSGDERERLSDADVHSLLEQAVRGLLEPTDWSCLIGRDAMLNAYVILCLWYGEALEALWREATTQPGFRRSGLPMDERARKMIRKGPLVPEMGARERRASVEAEVKLLELVRLMTPKRAAETSAVSCPEKSEQTKRRKRGAICA